MEVPFATDLKFANRLVLNFSMCKLLGVRAGVVGYDLAGAGELPFVDQQAFEAYGAAGVDLVGADADLGAEVVAVAVAEASAAVPENVS